MLGVATANKIRLKFMSLTEQCKLNLRTLLRFRILKQDFWDSSDLTPFHDHLEWRNNSLAHM